MKNYGGQLSDKNGKLYPTTPSTTTSAKIFVQATAPSGAGEADGDIWIKTA